MLTVGKVMVSPIDRVSVVSDLNKTGEVQIILWEGWEWQQ